MWPPKSSTPRREQRSSHSRPRSTGSWTSSSTPCTPTRCAAHLIATMLSMRAKAPHCQLHPLQMIRRIIPMAKCCKGWRLVSRKIYMLMLAAAGDLPAGAHLQRGGCPGQNQVPFPHGQEAADRHIRPGDPHQGGEFHFVTVAALDSLQGCPHLHPSQPRAASQCPLHALQRACSNSRIWCRVLQLDYENTVHSTIPAASSSPCIPVSTTCASEDTQQDRRTEGYMWCRWIMRTGC